MALYTTAWLPLAFLLTIFYGNDPDTTQLSLLFWRTTGQLWKTRQAHLLWRKKKSQFLSFMQRINKTAVTHKELHSWGETESHCSKNQRRTKRFNEDRRPKPFLLRGLHPHAEHNLTSSPSGLPNDVMELLVLACRHLPELLLFPGLLSRWRAKNLLSGVLCSSPVWIPPISLINTGFTLLDIYALRCFVIWYIITLLQKTIFMPTILPGWSPSVLSDGLQI